MSKLSPKPGKSSRVSQCWYQELGFATEPSLLLAPEGGLIVYRAWGGNSTEWGTGFFSLEKPASVLDAELRFNIAEWGNTIWFVSTFQIPENVPYRKGPVLHGLQDFSRRGTQIYVEPEYMSLVKLVHSKQVLRSDVFVQPKSGTA